MTLQYSGQPVTYLQTADQVSEKCTFGSLRCLKFVILYNIMGGGVVYGYWDVGKEGQKIVGCEKRGEKNSGMWEFKK